MRLVGVAILCAALAIAAPARAQVQSLSADQNYDGIYGQKKLFGLAAPDRPTAATSLHFVTPGPGILKASAMDGTVQNATVNVDYVGTTFTLGGDLSGTPGNANVIRLLETGGPTHLAIGAWPDGTFLERVGSTAVGVSLTSALATRTVANVTALEALAGSSYTDGAAVYVSSVAADFVLHTTSSVTVDHITIASVSGMSGARWIRRPQPDGYWYQTGTQFYLGGAGASDENNCTAAITPCATAAEIRRRIQRRIMPLGATQSFTYNVQGDAGGDFDPITVEIDPTRNSGTTVTVVGTPTVTAIGTIASATAANYSANQANEICVTAYNWSTHVGKIVRKVGTTGILSVTAVVVADLGSGCARISESNQNTVGAAALTTGDVIEELTTLPRVMGLRSLGNGAMVAGLINFDPTGTTTNFEVNNGSTVFVIGSYINGTGTGSVQDTARGIAFLGCSFSRGLNIRGSGSVSRSVVFNSTISVANSAVGRNEWQAAILVNSTYAMGEFLHTRFHSLGVYNLGAAASAITLADGSSTTHTQAIYGSGNNATSRIFSFLTRGTVNLGTTVAATSGLVAAIPAASVTLTNADLPYYEDIYGNAIYGAQNVDPYKHLAVAGGDIAYFAAAPSQVAAIHETSGPTQLTIGAIANGQVLTRSGTTIVGSAAGVSSARTLTAGAGMTGGGDLSADRTFNVGANADGSITVNADDIQIGTLINGTPIAGRLLATAIAAPSTPALGKGAIYVDSTSKNIAIKNDAGTVNHGAQTFTAATHQFATALSDAGAWTTAQPSYSDLSGSVPAITALTGDVTASGTGSVAATLATIGGGAGSCTYCSVTFDAKGRQTAYSSGTAPVTSVSGTSGRISSTGGTTPVLDLITTAVTPGSYTATNLTVDAYGRITAASNGSTGGGGTVTSVSATLPLTSTGGTTPTIALNYDNSTITLNVGNGIQVAAQTGDVTKPAGSNVTTLATVNASPGTYPYATVVVNGKGLATSVTAGATPAPVGATYITQTADATLTNEQALGALASGVMQSTTTTGVVSTFAVGSARIPFGSGTAGALTDSANLKFNGQTFSLGSLQEVQVFNASTSTTALGGFRVGTDSSYTNSFAFNMPGTNWSGGALSPNAGLVELAAGSAPIIVSNFGTGKISFTTTSSRTERMAILTGGDVTVSSRLLIDGGAAVAPLSVNSGGGSTAIHFDGSGADSGGYLLSTTANQAIMSGGASYNGSWVAKSTAASIAVLDSGAFSISADSGLTSGVGYTPTTRLTVSAAGAFSVNGLGGGGLVWASNPAGTLAAANIASGSFVVSGGTGAPGAGARVVYDFTHDIFEVGDDATQAWYSSGTLGAGTYSRLYLSHPSGAWTLASEASGTSALPLAIDASDIGLSTYAVYHVGSPGATNYERVRTFDNSGQIVTQTEAGGTGDSNNVSLRTIAKQVDLCNGSCSSYFSIQPTGQLLEQGNRAVSSATSAVADAVSISPVATVSGSTAITTATGFNGVTVNQFLINSASTITYAAGLRVNAPTIGGGGSIINPYSLDAAGMIRVSNGGGALLEVPSDPTAGSDTTIDGRIPVNIPGVGVKYVRYYND